MLHNSCTNGEVTPFCFVHSYKILYRMYSWQNNFLSPQADRITLISFIVNSIPIHSHLVSYECRLLLSIKLNTSSNAFFGMHYISWNIGTLAKQLGGLGVHSMQLTKVGLYAKRVRRYLCQDNSLWFQQIKAKCGDHLPCCLISLVISVGLGVSSLIP